LSGIPTTELERPEFSARIRAGDGEAIETAVEAYLGQILRAARGAGLSPQEAEEVTQATFTTFIQTASRFEGRSKVRTWLFGILYKKIAETRRDRQKEAKKDSIDDVMEARFRPDGTWAHPPRALDDAIYYGTEVRQKMEECLAGCPTSQRMAFILREVEGLETGEICKILEVSRTNLGVLLHRARNRLRECLELKGVTG
jgi:RNA polymerase sigma-70 factor (ECF subfamily)